MMPQHLRTLAEIATIGILNSLLAGIAISLLAWAVTHLFGRQGAGTRFAVWFSALVAIAILPWVSNPGTGPVHADSGLARSAVTLPSTYATYLFVAWLVVCTFGLLRIGLSLFRLRQLRSRCAPVDIAQLGSNLRASLADMRSIRRVTLCTSDAVRVPAAIGYFHPIVVFPTWTLQEVPAVELEAILLHELAHLHRWDDWTNLAQKIVKAVFFFHPAVWFVDTQLTLEREMACDDAVLAANFNPRAYAESLLGLAEKSFLRRSVQLAQAAVSHVQHLKARIVEILRKDRQGRGRVGKPAIAMMAVAGILSAYGVSHGPHLFAFSGEGMQAAPSVGSANAHSLPGMAAYRPVNLSFVAPASQPTRVVHATSPTRLRIVRHSPMAEHVALAQREVSRQFVEAELDALPMMVPVNFATEQPGTAPTAVLVVMQSAQFGIDGPVFWHITVVHLTQAQQRAISGGIPKQI